MYLPHLWFVGVPLLDKGEAINEHVRPLPKPSMQLAPRKSVDLDGEVFFEFDDVVVVKDPVDLGRRCLICWDCLADLAEQGPHSCQMGNKPCRHASIGSDKDRRVLSTVKSNSDNIALGIFYAD